MLSASCAFAEGDKGISGDILGKNSGYIHPFLSLSESYNDNIYNTKDKEEDFITTIAPGIWLALPGTKEPIEIKQVSGTSPGGLMNTRFKSDIFNRYQTYVFYGPQFEIYSQNDDENATSQLLEGGLQYNLKSGLGLDIIDQYLKSHDARGQGVSTSLDEYENNLLDAIISYDITPKLQFRIGGSMYNVHYSDTRNNFKDRQDSAISGYLFFHVMPKTSVYTGYDRVNVDYEDDAIGGFSDSDLNKYFAGVKWEITAKSKGNLKAGYVTRDFDKTDNNDSDGFYTELVIDHNFTNSTGISLRGSKSNLESDIVGSSYTESTAFGITYNQNITAKITASLDLRWENLDYQNIVRNDDMYVVSPKLQYVFTDWLTSDLVYSYKTRKSDSDPGTDYDYENNTFMIKLTGAL